ncbi:DNA excision repair protein ERCC-1 [Parasteatoda tepidariorum]|uniref:DNA excision repair protein ERCC-1 n=1 Tax=Parasteatoda tepidariorum TaxID=114398 RepID=UPI000A2C0B2F|nr:DNA excision repair protein ERCC-1 [Parasteatoda tepidariorum]
MSNKKFSVPETIDDSFDDIISGPQCFKSGKVLTEKESSESTSSTLPSSDKNESTSSKAASTRFEKEFLNLRESKFFDGSIDNQSEKKHLEKPGNYSAILVNPRQRGNPLLKHIRNVPWEFGEIEPDYVIGKTSCALFLSLRYHNLYPNYIHDRLKALGKSYNLRVLLVQVDVTEPNPPLKDLSVISILADCTLMVCWSAEEAGSYLETYKMFENKSADFIKKRQDNDNYSQLVDCLTTIRSINKTDAMVLLSTFKTLKGIVSASVEELTLCHGMGPLKANRLYEALRKPLKKEKMK